MTTTQPSIKMTLMKMDLVRDGDCNDDDPLLYPIEIENELYCGISSYEYSPTNMDFYPNSKPVVLRKHSYFKTREKFLLIHSIENFIK